MAGTILHKIDVVYEDDTCVVLNKPAGLAVQGGKGVGVSLDGLLARAWGRRPLLVHRLDKDTSGLILVAKTKPAAAGFSKLFSRTEHGTVTPGSPLTTNHYPLLTKKYLAICKGRPVADEGVITVDLDIRGNIKKSKTFFKLLEFLSSESEFSVLELELGTGRMHQIRRHLASAGTPVLGDDKFGDFGLNKKLRKTMNLRRLLLHASRLIIPQTPDGVSLDVTAPPPDHFKQFLEIARK